MQYSNPHIELCLEGSSSIFKGLDQSDKELIAERHTLAIIGKGSFLFKEGEKTRGLIFLASGKAKIFKKGVGGREQILKMEKPGGLIGYRTLFSENTWSVSSAAVEDSVICVMEKHAMVKILQKNPDLSLKFTRILSEELWLSYNRTVSLTQKHVRGRLVESLLLLGEIYGYEADGKTIKAILSRDDIAHLSSMTTSNAIRTLSSLASEGYIGIKGRRISIPDIKTLEHISEQA